MDNTVAILSALVALAIGSGGGGIVGAIVVVRRFRIEQEESRTKQRVSLQEIDVEQFKAMFPGGLGDAVAHWKKEATDLYQEVAKLRSIEQVNYEEILVLRTELDRTKLEAKQTKLELDQTKVDLERANQRIAHLEAESGNSDE